MESETTAKSEDLKTSADEESSTTTGAEGPSFRLPLNHPDAISAGAAPKGSTPHDALPNDENDLDDDDDALRLTVAYSSEGNDAKARSLLHGTFGIAIPSTGNQISVNESNQIQMHEPVNGSIGERKNVKTSVVSTESINQESCYVNQGLAAWETNRQQWLQNKGNSDEKTTEMGERHAIPLDIDAVIDAVFSTPQKMRMTGGIGEPFAQPVPLPQMVDILQDLWEAESL